MSDRLCKLGAKMQSCTVSLLDKRTVRIDACSILFGLLFSQSEDVLQTIQRDLHDLRVHHGEKVTHGLDSAQRNQVPIHTKEKSASKPFSLNDLESHM